MKSTVLFISANPPDTSRIGFDTEHSHIVAHLGPTGRTTYRDRFVLETALAAGVSDFLRLLLAKTEFPLAVVHWSGHGRLVSDDPGVAEAALAEGPSRGTRPASATHAASKITHGEMLTAGSDGDAQAVPTAALAKLFGDLRGSIRCVVLNACHSEALAQQIAAHVDFVVGTRRAIPDRAAIAFSDGFYLAIGNGESLERAFQIGKDAVGLLGFDPESLLRRYCREGVRPDEIVLAGETGRGGPRTLTSGTERWLPSEASQVQKFLDEYLGTPARPVPFGGRARALAEFEGLLADDAAPLRVLVAPAGRGKSAVVSRWAAGLHASGACDVVFVPVSIRFDTAKTETVWGLLAARLLELRGEELRGEFPEKLGALRSIVYKQLRDPWPAGRRVVVVLDALDEGSWAQSGHGEIRLPTDLAPQVRVLASVRQPPEDPSGQELLRDLGWEDRGRVLQLDRLDDAGIREVLVGAGGALDALAGRPEVVTQLRRLTEGDPLLLRLYVDELREKGAGLGVEELAKLKPGLGGWFKRWLSKQAEGGALKSAVARTVLGLFACARGPLRLDELHALAAHTKAGPAPDSLELRDAIKDSLRRLVLGDAENGYSLSHPQIGIWYRGQLLPTELDRYEACYLAWGREALERAESEAPLKAPRYLMRWYARHFEREGAPVATLLRVLDAPWQRACQSADGDLDGFQEGVDAVCDVLGRLDEGAVRSGGAPAWLGARVRAELILSSIRRTEHNVPAALLGLALEFGAVTPERVFKQARRANEARRCELVAATARVMPPDRLPELLTLSRSFGNDAQRACMLAALAPALPHGALFEAFTEAGALRDPAARSAAIVAVVLALPEGAALDPRAPAAFRVEALAAVRALDGPQRFLAFGALARALPPEDRPAVLREALAAARDLYNEADRTDALCALAPSVSDDLALEALAAARELRIKEARLDVLVALAPRLPPRSRSEALGEALATARALVDTEARRRALVAVAAVLPREDVRGELLRALDGARSLHDEDARVRALAALAPRLPPEEQGPVLHEAFAVACALDDEARSRALAALAPLLPAELAAEALPLVRALHDEGGRVEAVGALARRLPREERDRVLAGMLTATRAIHDEAPRLDALLALARALPPEQRTPILRAALPMIRATHERDRFETLYPVISILPESLMPEALAVIRTLASSYTCSQAFVALAPGLPEALVPEAFAVLLTLGVSDWSKALIALPHEPPASLLSEALAAVGTMDSWSRDVAIMALAPVLPASRVPEAFAMALDLEEYHRTRALVALAPALPESLVPAALAASEGSFTLFLAVAPHLPRDARRTGLLDALHAAGEKSDERLSQTLCELASAMPGEVTPEILATADTIQSEGLRAETLELVQYLCAIGNGGHRARVLDVLVDARWKKSPSTLGGLADALPPEERSLVLRHLLVALRSIRGDEDRATSLFAFARTFPPQEQPPLFREALDIVRAMGDEARRSDAFVSLARYCPAELAPEVFPEVLVAVRSIHDEVRRSNALAELASSFPAVLAPEVFSAVRSIRSDAARCQALLGIAPTLPAEFVREAVALVRSLEAGTSHRFDAFLACAKRSPAELMPEALAMACTFSDEDERRRALCALAPELEPRELLGLVTALSELGRPATLAVVAASVPSLLRAGGAEPLLRVADAIREVATRWP